MKTITLKNRRSGFPSDLQTLEDFYIIMQMYNVVKAEASNKQLPLLPSGDFRKPTLVLATPAKTSKISLMHYVTDHLHALTALLFKRTAA